MKKRKPKTNFRVTGGTNFWYYGSALAALSAAEKHKGLWAEQCFNGEWKKFTVDPAQDWVGAVRAVLERQWREDKNFYPYYLTDAGEDLGVDALHATGLSLLDLEKLGLIDAGRDE